jgi:hypothetical protein
VRDSPCPRFRQDLVVRRVVEAGDVGYTIRDPLSGDYYRQHPMTRQLCTLLDGERTPNEVLGEMGRRYPQYSFSRDFLQEALESLRRMDFLEDTFKYNLMLIERGRVERRLLEPDPQERAPHPARHRRPLAAVQRIHPRARHLHAGLVMAAVAIFTLSRSPIYDRRGSRTTRPRSRCRAPRPSIC